MPIALAVLRLIANGMSLGFAPPQNLVSDIGGAAAVLRLGGPIGHHPLQRTPSMGRSLVVRFLSQINDQLAVRDVYHFLPNDYRIRVIFDQSSECSAILRVVYRVPF
jgi:hypothetical protein